MPKPYDDTRERIRVLYPGDENKGIRHALYSKPDFLASNPTDQMIHDEAGFHRAPITHPDAPASKPIEGEVIPAPIDFGAIRAEADQAVAGAALPLTSKAPVAVATAEDYLEAEKGYAAVKAAKKDLETKRVKVKAPALDLTRYIDQKFNEAQAMLDAELGRFEKPMLEFKAQEREMLRKQEEERQRAIREEQERARAEAEEARMALEVMQQEVDTDEDPFLAALRQPAIEEKREEVRTALRDVALAPARVTLPEAAPVVGAKSRVSYPWVAEVVNESEVERKYCSPDTSKLGALAKYLKSTIIDISKVNPADYPGIRIKEDIRIGGR
jgi:hypothetical protein